MILRHAADVRTLIWVLALAPATVAVQYARPDLVKYLSWLSCYFALSCAVIAHNHNHSPTFKTKRMNQFFSSALTFFYGYPSFAWIPTHNLNHHKYVNKAGDATITWRWTNRHNLPMALVYFFMSSYWQSGPIKEFIAKAKATKPKLYRSIITQYVAWVGLSVVAMLSLAIWMHGVKTGLFVWTFTFFVPGFFAMWTIMLFNYEQHVHTDPWSKHSHSRSFDGRMLNFLLFNNGYHAAHHENPGTHWSQLREIHDEIAPEIHPDLIQSNLWWYWLKQYFLAPIFPSLGSTQIGRAPFSPPDGSEQSMATAGLDVIGDVGTNASRT